MPSTGRQSFLLTEMEAMFDSEQQWMAMSNETARRNADVGTIHIGLGIIFVALGVVLIRRLSATAPALLLGGVLLILLGAPVSGVASGAVDPLSGIFGLLSTGLPGTLSDAGNARDIARFVVLLVGVAILAGLVHLRWERESSGDARGESDS